jgi:hypothetical protein
MGCVFNACHLAIVISVQNAFWTALTEIVLLILRLIVLGCIMIL